MTRFAMNAKGGRFVAGLFFTIAGFALVGLIVLSAHLGDGLQGEPPFSYDWLWGGGLQDIYKTIEIGIHLATEQDLLSVLAFTNDRKHTTNVRPSRAGPAHFLHLTIRAASVIASRRIVGGHSADLLV